MSIPQHISRRAALGILALATTLLAGCGGGGNGKATVGFAQAGAESAWRRAETHRETLRRVEATVPALLAPIAELTAVLDDRWFGMRPASSDDYQRLRASVVEHGQS